MLESTYRENTTMPPGALESAAPVVPSSPLCRPVAKKFTSIILFSPIFAVNASENDAIYILAAP